RVEAKGWPLRLVDTAGLRDASDVVERLGIEVSERHIREAHVILVCAESREGLEQGMERVEGLGEGARIAVLTKADRGVGGENLRAELAHGAERQVAVSATTRQGLDDLVVAIGEVLARSVGAIAPDHPVVTRARHREALARALREMEEFLAIWNAQSMPASV